MRVHHAFTVKNLAPGSASLLGRPFLIRHHELVLAGVDRFDPHVVAGKRRGQRGLHLGRIEVGVFLENQHLGMVVDRERFFGVVVVDLEAEQRWVVGCCMHQIESELAVEEHLVVLRRHRPAFGNTRNRAIESIARDENPIVRPQLLHEPRELFRIVVVVHRQLVAGISARSGHSGKIQRDGIIPMLVQGRGVDRDIGVDPLRRGNTGLRAGVDRGEGKGIRCRDRYNQCDRDRPGPAVLRPALRDVSPDLEEECGGQQRHEGIGRHGIAHRLDEGDAIVDEMECRPGNDEELPGGRPASRGQHPHPGQSERQQRNDAEHRTDTPEDEVLQNEDYRRPVGPLGRGIAIVVAALDMSPVVDIGRPSGIQGNIEQTRPGEGERLRDAECPECHQPGNQASE